MIHWNQILDVLGGLRVFSDLAILGYVGFQVVRGVRHLLARRRRELDRFRRPGVGVPANFTEDFPGRHAIRPGDGVG